MKSKKDDIWRNAYDKRTEEIARIIKPLPEVPHTQTIMWHDLEDFINRQEGFNDSPDYQRGHVWTEKQQASFIEGVIRGTVSKSLLSIKINNPLFDYNLSIHQERTGEWISDLPNEVQVIDGKQRLASIRKFMKNELLVFNQFYSDDLNQSYFSSHSRCLEIQTMAFTKKADLLKFYLDLNTGGTMHSPQEISHVETMLALCLI